ncbi:MAG: C39 family peptidase [bacterium]|nr:C39 family peptidase [bacterium]
MKFKLGKILIPLLIILAISFFIQDQNQQTRKPIVGTISSQLSPAPTIKLPTPTLTPTLKAVNLDIPFTSQAPFGNWKDPKQQDGCEEAVSLMAVYFAQGKSLTKQEALDQITNISNYETEKFGSYQDTSAEDTMNRIIKGYFGYNQVFVKKNITPQDIINELSQKHAVIVPLNGRLVGNPNYTAPGPERHNLVIRGYDPKTDEFITNDNGTRLGENYRYKKGVLFSAIRDYPTGDHIPIQGISKAMIVVY